MEQFDTLKQMVQFNKNAFDQGYNAMEMLRKQNEKMTNSILDQATWMPEEGKKAVNEWMQLFKKGCEDFKKKADQNYKNIENLLAGANN
jgi:polyhydroxyalkanoate synthesis regulator phasin